MRKVIIFAVNFFSGLLATSIRAQPYNKEICGYADSLYHSFSCTQQISGMLSFDKTARIKWNNFPVGMLPRSGMSMGNMSHEQQRLVHRVLSASLCSQGYLKATGIMQLDNPVNSYYDSFYYQKKFGEDVLKQHYRLYKH